MSVNGERQNGRATIRDIAAHAGVSITTVSRVLNDRPDVAQDTREAVLEAAAHAGQAVEVEVHEPVLGHAWRRCSVTGSPDRCVPDHRAWRWGERLGVEGQYSTSGPHDEPPRHASTAKATVRSTDRGRVYDAATGPAGRAGGPRWGSAHTR